MQSVAQAWLVLRLTGSPLRLGLIGALQFAPVLVFSVVAGALADRLPKRRLILGTQTVLAGQALTLAGLVWSGRVRYWHVGALALVMGLANAVDMPVRQSYVVDLVGKADLVSAVALNSAAFNAARVVGPATAGLLIAHAGEAPAFLLNGLSFVAVIATLLVIRTEGWPGPRRTGSVVEQVLEGVRYALRTPEIAFMLSLVFVVSLCVFNFSIFVPLLARDVLGVGPDGLGLLMTAVGLGAVSGALCLAARSGQVPRTDAIVASGGVACLGILVLATVRQIWLAAGGLAVVGFAAIVFIASCNTTLQLAAPDELRGRVMSLHTLMFSGPFPLGSLLIGALAERWGAPVAFAAAGTTGVVSLLALWLRWRRRGAGGYRP